MLNKGCRSGKPSSERGLCRVPKQTRELANIMICASASIYLHCMLHFVGFGIYVGWVPLENDGGQALVRLNPVDQTSYHL